MNATNAEQYKKLTGTPVPQLIISLSIPTILSMLVTNIYNLADTAFVGKIGTSASGAVGIVFGYMAILQAIGFLFGQGCGAMMSRKLGERDVEGAGRIASTGFFSALALASFVALISAFNLDRLVYWFGSTPTIAPYAKTYIGFILAAAPFLVSSFTLNNILRYEGKAALGTVGMMTGAVLNIIGDPIFMFGLKMGVAGAGLSTAISQVVSFSILLSMFLRGKTEVRLSIRSFTADPREFFDVVGTGMPSLLRQGLGSLATVVLNFLAGPFGDCAIAAMSIVSKVSFFVFSIALGMGQGFQPVSAFNYGAKKYKRLREAYFVTIFIAEVLMCVLAVVVYLNAGPIVGVFRDDLEVIKIGTRALRLNILSLTMMPMCMITEMIMQSTGRKLAASLLSAARGGLIFLPLLIIMTRLRGLAGIQEAQPLANCLSILPAVYCARNYFRTIPKEDGQDNA